MPWSVYTHTSPSGKVYVGITSQAPEKRWKGGSGYVRSDNHQPLFANAIIKYGWENISHKIIASNLTKEEACSIEKALIAKYKRQNKSYNITDGGEGGTGYKHTAQTRSFLRKLHLGRKEDKDAAISRVKKRVDNYPYVVVAVKGTEIHVFKTAKEAAKKLGINNRSNISTAIAGKQCLVHGYVFIHWNKTLPIDVAYLSRLYTTKLNNRYKKHD